LNTFTTQQHIFAEAKWVYWCSCNDTPEQKPPYPGSYEQSQAFYATRLWKSGMLDWRRDFCD